MQITATIKSRNFAPYGIGEIIDVLAQAPAERHDEFAERVDGYIDNDLGPTARNQISVIWTDDDGDEINIFDYV